jgi:hypothetical protein
MAAVALTTITNISNQVVPVLVSSIELNKANPGSSLRYDRAEQVQIAPGAQVTVETQRLDLGQLENLQKLKLLTVAAR